MMLRRRLFKLATAVAFAELAACSSPPAQYYQLMAIPGAILNTPPRSIRIRNIGVPAYLDQTNIAKASGAYQFAFYSNTLWAEPLADMLQSTLMQNLTQRLPQMTITGTNGVVNSQPDLLVEINLLRFDPDPSGSITLLAQLALKTAPAGNILLSKTIQTSATPASTDAAGSAAVMSNLWAKIADEIAKYAANGEMPKLANLPG